MINETAKADRRLDSLVEGRSEHVITKERKKRVRQRYAQENTRENPVEDEKHRRLQPPTVSNGDRFDPFLHNLPHLPSDGKRKFQVGVFECVQPGVFTCSALHALLTRSPILLQRTSSEPSVHHHLCNVFVSILVGAPFHLR